MVVGRMGTALKESATDKPNSTANPIFVSPVASSGGGLATEIANQGTPNAGGPQAWPVVVSNPTTGFATEATLEDVDLDVEEISTHLTDGSARIGGTTAVSMAGAATEATLEDIDVDVEAVTTELQLQRRPSQATGRAHKKAYKAIQNGNVLLYTVTAGKTLYVCSMVLTLWNTSAVAGANQDAEVDILDGTNAAGAIVLPIAVPPNAIQIVGGILGAQVTPVAVVFIAPTFPEPLPFTAGVYLKVAVGAVRYSAFMIGYEE